MKKYILLATFLLSILNLNLSADNESGKCVCTCSDNYNVILNFSCGDLERCKKDCGKKIHANMPDTSDDEAKLIDVSRQNYTKKLRKKI
jgi:hypothetical protein